MIDGRERTAVPERGPRSGTAITATRVEAADDIPVA